MAITDQTVLLERARRKLTELLPTIAPTRAISVELARAMLRRIPNVLRAVELLSEHDLVAEARALGRVLVETSIRLAWVLQKDGIDRTAADRELYAQCLVHIDEREAQKAALLTARTDAEQDEPQLLDQFTEEVLEILQGRKRDGERVLEEVTENLAGPNMADMAKQAGGQLYLVHYVRLYKFFCQDAHATIQSGVETLEPKDPSAHDISLSLINEALCTLLDVGSQLLGANDLAAFVGELRTQLNQANARRLAERG